MLQDPKITPELIKRHGLKPEEYDLVLSILGRVPTFTELGVFSVMWSEHCSYKNSKPLLRLFPTEGPRVLQGPGENAGVVALGDGLAVCFKMESHNHPSAVEPYQGAATGVGGILRDIFTMGARPVALVDCLFFGEPGSSPAVDHIIGGVVHGIADYGNCVGVPTVAGQVTFAPVFAANPLVNAMAVGVMKEEELTRAKARTVGNIVVYYGNSTGRDGVHGATFASEELNEETKKQRSAVQVGDPFAGKKILEATLELIKSGAVEAIQDMGAAGLTCSSCEIAGRGRLGMELDLDAVPQRAANMSPYEMMLSESQERMLAVIPPDRVDAAMAILEKWETNPAKVGIVTGDGLLTVRHKRQIVAQLPALKVSEESPVYDRESREPADRPTAPFRAGTWADALDLRAALLDLLSHPTIATKRWIHEQFDTQVQTNTVLGPGAGAAVLRVDGTKHLLAISTGVESMKVAIDPFAGGQLAVGEAALNLWCVGAQPLGLTDNLNFGNPEKPEQFWYFRRAVEGVADAARRLEIPVTGGNVSLYNESPIGPIWPTPTIGMVGVIEDPTCLIRPGFKTAGESIFALGELPQTFAGSFLAWLKHGKQLPAPLAADSTATLGDRLVALQAALKDLVAARVLASAADVTEGGLAVAVAEACLFAPSALGADLADFADVLPDLLEIEPIRTSDVAAALFGEGGALVLVSVSEANRERFMEILDDHPNVDITELGVVTEAPALVLPGDVFVGVEDLRRARETMPFGG